MMREKQEPVPQPDRVVFGPQDVFMHPIGLCAPCLQYTAHAGREARVGSLNHRVPKDVEKCEIVLPSRSGMAWFPGAVIPTPAFLAELALLFGPDASFTGPNNSRLPLFAVTTVNGTMMCWQCAAYHKEK